MGEVQFGEVKKTYAKHLHLQVEIVGGVDDIPLPGRDSNRLLRPQKMVMHFSQYAEEGGLTLDELRLEGAQVGRNGDLTDLRRVLPQGFVGVYSAEEAKDFAEDVFPEWVYAALRDFWPTSI